MKLPLLLSLAALVAVCSAADLCRHHDWVRTEAPAPREHEQRLIFALHHDVSEAELADACASVSSPSSPTYGKYFSQADVAAFLMRSSDRADRVVRFLTASGATDVTVVATGDMVSASMTVDVMESVFGGHMEVFRHPHHATAILVRSLSQYVLPAAISSDVASVVGVSDFPPVRSLSSRAAPPTPTPSPSPPVPTGEFFLGLSVMGADQAVFTLESSGSTLMSTDTALVSWKVDGGDWTKNYTIPSSGINADANTVTATTSEGFPGPYHRIWVNIYIVSAANPSQPVAVGVLLPPSAVNALGDGLLSAPIFDPAAITSFYNVTSPTAHVANCTQAVAEFSVSETFKTSDLKTYLRNYNVPEIAKVSVVGPNDESQPAGIESSMDIELIMGFTPSVDTTFWLVADGQALNGSFVLEWAYQMSEAASPPLVTSISYGLPEAALPSYFDASYATRSNAEFAKLCLRGLTTVVCTQDAGADAEGRVGAAGVLAPEFPATSQFVTGIGSTLATKQDGVTPRPGRTDGVGEAVVSLLTGAIWTTGGGFSSIFTRPSYQEDAVNAYVKSANNGIPSKAPTGNRAFPDVVSIGRNYYIVVDGQTMNDGDGTSSSTPIFSAILSQINLMRLQAGKPAIGFANPMLYDAFAKHPEAFYDVTVGNNRCGAFACSEIDIGYEARPGYDAASGLGSLGDFSVLAAAFMDV